MNRTYLKQLAKDNLKRNYKNILLWIIIAGIVTLSFVSIDVSNDGYSTGIVLTIFNINFDIESALLFKVLAGTGTIIAVIQILVGPAITYGLNNKLKYYSYSDDNTFDFFSAFKENYKDVFVLNFMVGLKTILWALLFIIPGIIAAYKYRYVNEIYEEHKDWNYKQVIQESIRMTDGHKWELFVLDLSFFLWYLFCSFLDVLTFGIASILLKPYIKMTNVYAYHYLSSQNYNNTL